MIGSRQRALLHFVMSLSELCSKAYYLTLVVGVLTLNTYPIAAVGQQLIVSDDFESGIGQWTLLHNDSAVLRDEVGQTNTVLELRPANVFPLRGTDGLSYVLTPETSQYQNFRAQGRFLFPGDGDGYLGFIYNYSATRERTDFGSIYVKSNGSYLRISPHYDGNPSWRLYEEFKKDLTGDSRIRIGEWHQFRLDVRGQSASLFIDRSETPTITFDQFINGPGDFGFEARPGNGEVVWIDDIEITQLPNNETDRSTRDQPDGQLYGWQVYGPMQPVQGDERIFPDLQDAEWHEFVPDWRGALIPATLTQSATGNRTDAYLRAHFNVANKEAPLWLALSTANQLDVWVNGYFRGTVAAESYIWSDFLTTNRHRSSRIPVLPNIGENTILLRFHGDRFAGGGFFAAIEAVD